MKTSCLTCGKEWGDLGTADAILVNESHGPGRCTRTVVKAVSEEDMIAWQEAADRDARR